MNKTIAVLGGSGGLGSQLYHLIKDKYNVISLSSKTCNVRNFNQCKELFNLQQVDIVLNLAGTNYDKFIHKMDTRDLEQVSQVIETNIAGAINVAAACLPGMRERGYGRLIYISSILATKDVLATSVYSSSKAFVDRFVKSVSAENISRGITANSIQLGYFEGGLTEKLKEPKVIQDSIGLKRWGKIEELYNAIEFFINTEYATGINLALSGGI